MKEMELYFGGRYIVSERVNDMNMMDEIEEYEAQIKAFNMQIQKLKTESSLNLEASAKAYTACGNYQKRIINLEDSIREAIELMDEEPAKEILRKALKG